LIQKSNGGGLNDLYSLNLIHHLK